MRKRIFTAGVTLALAVLAGITWTAYDSLRGAESSAYGILHAARALAECEELLSEVKAAESAQRGYVFTGNPRFLQEYETVRRGLPRHIAELRELVHDADAAALAGLERALDERLDALDDGIVLKRERRSPGELTELVSGRGATAMVTVRERVHELRTAQKDRLGAHTAAWKRQSRASALSVGTGSALAFVALLGALALIRRELTAREAAQRRAEDYGRELEDLYDHAPCGYHSLDARGRFVRINETELRWLGYAREELLGTPFVALLTPDGQATFERRFPAFMRDGAVSDLEFDLRRRDGSVLPVSLAATALRDARGEFVASRSTLFDITARRAAEAKARELHAALDRRNAELTAANEELESFSYSVSHDLRVPLRAIDGYSRMLEEDLGDRLAGDDRRRLSVIRDSVQRMGQLIDDLLAFSRYGRKALALGPVDMMQLVREACARIDEGGASLAPILTVEPLPEAWGDPALLREVWTNLLSNAVKFSAGRTAPAVRVSGCRGERGSLYRVRDNGAGFDMRYVDKLFGVFQRLHGQHEFPGTGVGLAIVKRIVTRHGGRVWAQGKLDQGAEFQFVLPYGPSHE